jgi:hypothetical protein
VNRHQQQQRADAGRGQCRDDGDRVDQALVENAEDEVDDEERCGYEDRRARQRRSECLGVALKAGLERERRVQLFFNRLNSAYCLRIIWGENRAQVRSEPEKTVCGGKPLILISNFTHRARRGACLRFGQYAKRSPAIP